MPRLTPGNKLPERACTEVLAAFGYRWTQENIGRARSWSGRDKEPASPPPSDTEWLSAHAFYVNKDGSLMAGRHALPASLAD